MPVSFWGDEEGIKYHDAYYSMFPGIWQHGDWITIADDGSCVISGRSDATLNRGGVRLGTADFYSVVEADPAVADSLIIHLEDDQGGLGELLLFVEPSVGATIDDAARGRLAGSLRDELSPRHVPDEIVEVTGVPRTLSGKKLEIPVKRILRGLDPDKAASRDALANPAALAQYVEFSRDR
jgi:acetoacetyl-CoA synthetase